MANSEAVAAAHSTVRRTCMALIAKPSLAQPAVKAQALFDCLVKAPNTFSAGDVRGLINTVEQERTVWQADAHACKLLPGLRLALAQTLAAALIQSGG
ncbi:hypothetical protein WJX73_005186 [Symbiochloris irregularis]|uniref:Uncharacterized protein n=1 Tax=Symbiochloris irregularis TaxID=706552 RepID=A0AAW1NP83_9CHLO